MSLKIYLFFALIGVALSSTLIPEFLTRLCLGQRCPGVTLPLKLTSNLGSNYTGECLAIKGEGFLPDSGSCRDFYYCNDGKGIKITCTLGYGYHPVYQLCVPETMVPNCGKVFCPPTMLIGTVADPESCNRYYRCIYGVTMHYECDPGMIYSGNEGNCVMPNENQQNNTLCGDKDNSTFSFGTTTELPIVLNVNSTQYSNNNVTLANSTISSTVNYSNATLLDVNNGTTGTGPLLPTSSNANNLQIPNKI